MEGHYYKGIEFNYDDFYGESWEHVVSGVYKITNIENRKVYIGESVNVRERWLIHIRKVRRQIDKGNKVGTRIGRAIEKYGVDSFKFEILWKEEDPYKRKEKEIDYIKEYESTDKDKGYNIRKGYIGGVRSDADIEEDSIKDYLKHSRLTTKEIAKIHNVNKLTVWRINKGVSYKEEGVEYPIRKDIVSKQITLGIEEIKETCVFCREEGKVIRERNVYCEDKCYKEYKEYLREEIKTQKLKSTKPKNTYKKCEKCKKRTNTRTLKKYSNMCSKCRKDTNIENGFLVYGDGNKVYKEELEEQLYKMTFTEVAKIYGVSDNAVRRWCKRFGMPTDAKTYNTDIKREEFSIKMREIGKDKEGRRVGKFDIDGNYIEEYRSIAEAVRKHNGNGSIEKVLYGDRVTASGYKWKFLD